MHISLYPFYIPASPTLPPMPVLLGKPTGPKRGGNWRLNASILSDPNQACEIEKSIKEYFLFNDVTNVSPITLLAAHKATIGGNLSKLCRGYAKLDGQK